jgi:hypothetical protein
MVMGSSAASVQRWKNLCKCMHVGIFDKDLCTGNFPFKINSLELNKGLNGFCMFSFLIGQWGMVGWFGGSGDPFILHKMDSFP